MRILNYCHTVIVPVEQVFDWFKNLDKNYIKWHPTTHKDFQWVSEGPLGKGSMFRFEEHIKGHHHKMVIQVSEYLENQKLTFSSVRIYSRWRYLPHWLTTVFIASLRIKMEMTRTFEENANHSTTIHINHTFGSPLPVIGRMIDWITEHMIFSTESHLRHIQEEAHNMKLNLENQIKFRNDRNNSPVQQTH